jgi:hypothetical protein
MNSNIFYKLKYYKYKEKYINYKQNGGNKIFYLYTTGIADNGTLFLANRWNKIFRNSILRNIDSSFNHIIIKHYDPIQFKGSDERFRKILTEINEIVIINDNCLSTDQRKITSEFILEPIDFKNINNPHLIFDMAHILNYLPNKKRQINNHYDTSSNEIFNHINSVYIGWYSENENIDFDYLANSDFVKVFENGSVLTYIDRMIKFRFMHVSNRLEPQYPGRDFCNILDNVMNRGRISDNKAKVANIIMNIIMTTQKPKLNEDDLLREVISSLSS